MLGTLRGITTGAVSAQLWMMLVCTCTDSHVGLSVSWVWVLTQKPGSYWRAGTILCLPNPTPLDWELLEEKHFAFSIRPVIPSVGSILPPLNSAWVPRTEIVSYLYLACLLAWPCLGGRWRQKKEEGRGQGPRYFLLPGAVQEGEEKNNRESILLQTNPRAKHSFLRMKNPLLHPVGAHKSRWVVSGPPHSVSWGVARAELNQGSVSWS